MQYLPLPPGAGIGTILRQCRKKGWSGRQALWLAAAANYKKFCGNPWRVQPAGFIGADADALYGLYDSRRSSGPIERIRRPAEPFQSCPMCGSLGGRSLDHALPRGRYPEFSILHENLVPACTMCNTDEKGEPIAAVVAKSDSSIRIMIVGHRALWRIQFGPDLDALQFKAVALPTLRRRHRLIVEFHVQTLLGKEWRDSVRRLWGPLPAKLRRRVSAAPTVEAMRAELKIQLKDAVECHGVNSWDAGFLRGVLADPLVVAMLMQRVRALPP